MRKLIAGISVLDTECPVCKNPIVIAIEKTIAKRLEKSNLFVQAYCKECFEKVQQGEQISH